MALIFPDYSPVDIFIYHRPVIFTLKIKVPGFSPGFMFSCNATVYFLRLLQINCTLPQTLQTTFKLLQQMYEIYSQDFIFNFCGLNQLTNYDVRAVVCDLDQVDG